MMLVLRPLDRILFVLMAVFVAVLMADNLGNLRDSCSRGSQLPSWLVRLFRWRSNIGKPLFQLF